MKKQQKTNYIVSGEGNFHLAATDFELKKERGVQLQRGADGLFTVKMGKDNFTGRVISRKRNRYEVEVNGNYYIFSIDKEETVKRTKPLKNALAKNKNYSLRAPMPGKINEIFVSEGSEVKKGEPILILEAMKMQNQVLASCDSKVLHIKVKESQTVLGDQELVALQALGGNE